MTATTTAASLNVTQTATLGTTGGSGTGAVTFASNNANCTVASTTLTAAAAGGCTITATKAADTNYNVASSAGLAITTGLNTQAITFDANPGPVTYAPSGTFAVSAIGGASGNSVTFTVPTTTTVCSVSGTTVSILSAGTCTVAADQAGNGTYSAAAQTTQNITINKAAQTITGFTPATPLVLGASAVTLSATGGASGVAIAFTTSSASTICTVSGSQLSFTGVGTCNLTANQAGNGNYNAATLASASVVINAANPATPTVTSAVAGNAQATVSFTPPSNTGGAPVIDYTVSCGTQSATAAASPITVTGLVNGVAVNCSVTARTSAGNSAASASTSVTPIAPQTITFGAQPAQTYRPAPSNTFALNPLATATSNLPVTYSNNTPAVCTITGITVTIQTAGTCTINADQAGDSAFSAATRVSQNITIAQATQAPLTVIAPSNMLVSGTATLSTTGGSGSGAITYAVSSTPANSAGCSITGTTLTATTAGSCAVTATQAGDSNYLAGAASSAVTVTVSPLAITTFSGSTATGTGPASASFSGGGSSCTFDTANTGFVNAAQSAPGVSFPHGWFKLKLINCAVGSTVRVTISWPVTVPSNYLKFGLTPTSSTNPVFYAPSNVSVSGNTVSFDVTDGALGDDDLIANGTITDPSGPALQAAAEAVPVPTVRDSGLVVLAMLMLIAGWRTTKRRA